MEKNLENVLIGIKRFTSKADKPCTIGLVLRSFSQREMDYGSVGQVVDEIFMPSSFVLKDEHIGHALKLEYDVSSGRAYLNNVVVL
ncbi:MAG TPA: hypothetical protein VJ845_00510 [Haploplasma sp.]|nr:hypothetical protein [Haploplasma sp.]